MCSITQASALLKPSLTLGLHVHSKQAQQSQLNSVRHEQMVSGRMANSEIVQLYAQFMTLYLAKLDVCLQKE
jgi:hypothetical protein